MEIGQTLNQRYTLAARIGKGAMGIVYRATDLQRGQDVAIKVIARELAVDDDMLERFRREGEALRQLRHPNIVGFVDMFEHEAQHVIVMEYVPGGSLHTLLKQGPLPLERTRRMALELCDALTRAHHLNIIHRDLKPENVLLAADGTPKLTDFGVARLISEGTRLTGTGAQVGTPFYMSPEAWEGKPLDAQTDIWSLGILLYEMLSGQVPFNGDTIVAVMNKVLNAPLPELTTLRPDVPPGLAQVVKRMLARDKAERYQTMRELAADLERGAPLTLVAAKPRPGVAKPTRAQARPQKSAVAQAKQPGVSPWLALGLGVIALLLLAGVGLGLGAWWLASHPTVTPTLVATEPSSPPTPAANITEGRLGPVLFEDNFDGTLSQRWDFQPQPWKLAAVDGRSVLQNVPAQQGFARVPTENWTDYAAQFDFKFIKPDPHGAYYFYVNFRASDCPPTVKAVDTYKALISTEAVELYIENCEVRDQTRVAQSDRNLTGEGWHSAQVTAVGNRLQVRVDGQPYIDYTDAKAQHLRGDVWVVTDNNVELAIDNFRVSEIVPSAAAPSEAAATAVAKKILKVGILLPLSGPNAALGASARDGAQMAVDEWNAQGGLLNGTILPILADGQCSAEPAVAAANQLFDEEGVRYLIGELCSKASIPVSAIAESRGVVQISPASTDPRVTLKDNGSPKAYVFRAAFIDPFQGTVMANFALGQKLQRAFVVYDQSNPYSSGLAKYFMVSFENAGGTTAGQAAYTSQTTDFAVILDKVAASQAQVLFVPDSSGRVNLIAQQAKQRGLQAVLMGGDGWEGGDLDLGALDGGYYSTGYSPLAPQAGASAWTERYRAKYNRAPDAMAALAYDAANLLFTAIRQAGIDDPSRVKDALAGLQFEGVTGKITFDAQHNPLKSAIIMQIKDGQRVYAATVEVVP